jgi:hypothetical protein
MSRNRTRKCGSVGIDDRRARFFIAADFVRLGPSARLVRAMTALAMTNPWVCIECGGRQSDAGACTTCKSDEVLDARKEEVRNLMADVELRLTDRREARIRWTSVLIGVGVVFALWTIPGYWGLRGSLYPGLPFLADQWGFMILIGFGLLKLGGKVFAHKRFPYLNEQQQIVEP